MTVFIILGAVALFLGTVMVVALKMADPGSDLSFSDRIGVIPIEGPISESESVTSQLKDFRDNKKIKAIILRIDSPGGGVGPSQEIYEEVRKTSKIKKVIASLGSVGASGGYYIAAAADRIVANPGTITGSIGVVMEFFRFEELLDKIGVKLEVIKSGEFKDIGSPHRELTPRDREIIDNLIKDIQAQFVKAVAQGRGMSLDEVERIADGRVFSGATAKKLNLVDELGNFEDAVTLAKDMADIQGEAVLVYPRKSKIELWETFLKDGAHSLINLLQDTKPQLNYRWNGS